jgi:FkbM family methyltransferase
MYTTIGQNHFPTSIVEQFRVREIALDVPGIRRGVRMRLGGSDPEIFRQIFVARDYDHAMPDDVRVVIDAGANVGYASLWFAARFPQAQIVAIEPDRGNFRQIATNCRGLDRIGLIEAALWSHDGTIGLQTSTKEGMLPAMALQTWETGAAEAGENTRPVPAVSVTSLKKHFGIDRIDVFKIDIEGAEREVFGAGDRSWIDEVRCFIIEVHEFFRPGARKAVFDALPASHYEIVTRGENIYFYRRD